MSDSSPDLAAVRAALAVRLAELRTRGARVESDLAAPVSADTDEASVEREDDDALAGEDALLTREAAAVAAAIARVDAGDYGLCTRCGQAIAPARLAAQPEAALCIACARELGA